MQTAENFKNKFSTDINTYNATAKDDKADTEFGKFCKYMAYLYQSFMEDKSIFDNRQNGYILMERMGVKVCPYCNRSFTTVIDDGKISVRAEFDHFYPKSMFPILALSFYNLVPSCPTCNHLKKEQILDYNPWEIASKGNPKFKVDTSKGDFQTNPTIIIDNENENTKKLGIKQLYSTHTDYVKDLLNRIQAYNPSTFSAIACNFQGICSETDLRRLIWGNYVDKYDEGKRPLAKLTVDILEQFTKYIP